MNARQMQLFEKGIGICSVNEFAGITGYAPRTIVNKLSSGSWPFGIKLTSKGKWFINLDRFKIYLETRKD